MKITNIKVKNFLSYREFDFDIDRGLCSIAGPNGVGKSTIMDSVCYGLFGQTPRPIKIEDLIHNQFKKEQCLVEVNLEYKDKEYRIERSRNPNYIKFYINEAQVPTRDAKETQDTIEKTLGVTYSIFVNSVYFYQNAHSHFVSASDNEKKEILTELLNLSIFDKAYENVHEKLKKIDEKLIDVSHSLNKCREKQSSIMNDISSYEEASLEFETNRIKRIGVKENQIADIDKWIEKEKISVLEKKKEFDQVEGLNQQLSDIDSNQPVVDKAKLRYQELYEQQRSHSVKKELLLKQSKKILSQQEGECSFCNQKITKDHLDRESLRLTDQIMTEDIAEKEAAKLTEEVREIVDLGEKLDLKRRSIKEKLTSLKYLLNEIERQAQTITDKEKQIENIIQERQDIEVESNNYGDLISVKEKELNKNNAILLEAEKQNILLSETKNKLKFLKDVYRNVKYYVFDSVIEELNNKINVYVSSLFEVDVKVRFETETKLSSNEVKQKFKTIILKEGFEQDFHSFSGGEQRRIELATNFALSDIIANRSNKNFNIMVLDECFSGLDAEGIERVIYLLEVLKNQRENIFVIDHFETIESLIDSRIKIVKENGISRIE